MSVDISSESLQLAHARSILAAAAISGARAQPREIAALDFDDALAHRRWRHPPRYLPGPAGAGQEVTREAAVAALGRAIAIAPDSDEVARLVEPARTLAMSAMARATLRLPRTWPDHSVSSPSPAPGPVWRRRPPRPTTRSPCTQRCVPATRSLHCWSPLPRIALFIKFPGVASGPVGSPLAREITAMMRLSRFAVVAAFTTAAQLPPQIPLRMPETDPARSGDPRTKRWVSAGQQALVAATENVCEGDARSDEKNVWSA